MFLKVLADYRSFIEQSIAEALSSFGTPTPLRDAIEYALKNGGKRLRPSIVLMVGEALGSSVDLSDAALAVEYFHTATLIADDLPCMDDEEERRHHPALHKVFRESTALLATYALIAEGYDRIRRNAPNGKVLALAVKSAAHNAGIEGVTGGQFLDLNPSAMSEARLRELIQKKTSALFELSFVLGWLFGGGNLAQIPLVQKCAAHFGLIFQILDDFDDYEKDRKKEQCINYPFLMGREHTAQVLEEEFASLRGVLKKLRLLSPQITSLIVLLEQKRQESLSSTKGSWSMEAPPSAGASR